MTQLAREWVNQGASIARSALLAAFVLFAFAQVTMTSLIRAAHAARSVLGLSQTFGLASVARLAGCAL